MLTLRLAASRAQHWPISCHGFGGVPSRCTLQDRSRPDACALPAAVLAWATFRRAVRQSRRNLVEPCGSRAPSPARSISSALPQSFQTADLLHPHHSSGHSYAGPPERSCGLSPSLA